ncbi:glycine oxidase [Nocardioides daedukensis]|uniref:Glycine oxidase n=1 Tax=Nocardioides daedukensis TaxID=634462 RepID=A0A7Y9UU98_9ACTN|nr:FAD-dependent oxidoreductase [Nocardioides daedukensis]NYG60344.1 glycine oxidase [Nocardioides daedukensis]
MRVLVRGAGIIGLSVADELARRGHEVTVIDPTPGAGASHAAAGMLSPSSEVWHGEEEILRLGLRSMALWAEYAERLGVAVHRTGTLLVGHDRGDLQQVERQARLLGTAELLGNTAVRALEPRLHPRVAGGLLLADDHSVDPRAVVGALRRRVDVVPDIGAEAFGAEKMVLATGAHLPQPWSHLVRGVRGEIIRGHCVDPPTRTVRGWVRGRQVYVVPRTGGGIVIGATSEEHDAPPEVTLGGIHALIEDARTLLSGLDRATFTEAIARDRPASPDHLPLIGRAPGRDDVVLAAGLFRHGVLLAPLAAQLVADAVEGAPPDSALDPSRFESSSQEGNPC